MLDHVSLRVQDFGRALEFYRAALAPIGYTVVMEFPGAAGLGADGKPDFWIMQTDQALNPTHVAFSSRRDRVDAFHAAALQAGGSDNGAPGLRPDYHPHYYGAFIYDPEGNNVEVVCHEPPGVPKPAPRPAARRSAKAAKPARSAKTASKSKSGSKSRKTASTTKSTAAASRGRSIGKSGAKKPAKKRR